MDAGGRSSLMVGAALGLLALLALRAVQAGAASFSVEGVVADAVSGTVGVVEDAAAGVVLGVGDAVGVPRTDATLCEISKARGDALGVSKYCTAGDFLAWSAGQAVDAITPAPAKPPADNMQPFYNAFGGI